MRSERVCGSLALIEPTAPWVGLWDDGQLACAHCGWRHAVHEDELRMERLAELWPVWLAAHRDCTDEAVE